VRDRIIQSLYRKCVSMMASHISVGSRTAGPRECLALTRIVNESSGTNLMEVAFLRRWDLMVGRGLLNRILNGVFRTGADGNFVRWMEKGAVDGLGRQMSNSDGQW
jgi:hypothetical protein